DYGCFTSAPVRRYAAVASVTYRANDIVANSGIATVSLVITNVNRAPVATDDGYGLNKNSSLTVNAPGVLSNDTDLDGDALTAVRAATRREGKQHLPGDGSATYTECHHDS